MDAHKRDFIFSLEATSRRWGMPHKVIGYCCVIAGSALVIALILFALYLIINQILVL